MLYPTRVPAYTLHTRFDYVIAVIRAGRAAGGAPGDPAVEWKHGIDPQYCNDAGYLEQLKQLMVRIEEGVDWSDVRTYGATVLKIRMA